MEQLTTLISSGPAAMEVPVAIETMQQRTGRFAGRQTMTWVRCQHNFDFGVWCEASPMPHRFPDLVKIINKDQAVRKAPEYPGEKHEDSYCKVGSEYEVLDYKVFQHDNVQINCYRVHSSKLQVIGKEVEWLLDYSPNEDLSMLLIQYIN